MRMDLGVLDTDGGLATTSEEEDEDDSGVDAEVPAGFDLVKYLKARGREEMNYIMGKLDPAFVPLAYGSGATEKLRELLTAHHLDESKPKSVIFSEAALAAASKKKPPTTMEGEHWSVCIHPCPTPWSADTILASFSDLGWGWGWGTQAVRAPQRPTGLDIGWKRL